MVIKIEQIHHYIRKTKKKAKKLVLYESIK